MGIYLALFGIGCLILFVGAWLADSWDARERRDAKRRNRP